MGYKVVVVSTRCSTIEGMAAVSRYLDKNGIEVDGVLAEKPPALCYIDDRAICFDGHPERLPERVKNFKTWLEGQKRNDEPVERLRPCEAITYEKGNAEKYRDASMGGAVTTRSSRWDLGTSQLPSLSLMMAAWWDVRPKPFGFSIECRGISNERGVLEAGQMPRVFEAGQRWARHRTAEGR